MVGDDVIVTPELLFHMRIPKKHWLATMDQIPDECGHKEPLSTWLESVESNLQEAKGILLIGEYSMGKSAAAAICLKAACVKRKIGLWIKAQKLPEYCIKDTVFNKEMTMMERASTVPLLVIDEVVILDVKFSENTVESLIRDRIDRELCTIVTTNHSRQQLKDTYPALVAALTEAVRPIAVSGHNFREALQKEW